MNLTFDCDLIDRQGYLDGTRELTLEGEAPGPAVGGWSLTLTLRWPKDEDPDEGDLSVTSGDGAALYAGLAGGTISETLDEGGDSVLELALAFTIASGEGVLADRIGTVNLEGAITGERARLVLALAGEPAGA